MAKELAGTVVPTPFGMVRVTKALLSRALGLSRSALSRPIPHRGRASDMRLVAIIKDVLLKHPRYGYRQIAYRCCRSGLVVNKKRILRLMREHKLLYKPPRRPKWRSSGAHGHLEDLSRFEVSAPNELWLTDTTFVRVRSRWAYLAVILDAFSRRCVGWAIEFHHTADLTTAALRTALASRRPHSALIHHSDRGSQYVAAQYQDALVDYGAHQSFSRPGTPTDNSDLRAIHRNA